MRGLQNYSSSASQDKKKKKKKTRVQCDNIPIKDVQLTTISEFCSHFCQFLSSILHFPRRLRNGSTKFQQDLRQIFDRVPHPRPVNGSDATPPGHWGNTLECTTTWIPSGEQGESAQTRWSWTRYQATLASDSLAHGSVLRSHLFLFLEGNYVQGLNDPLLAVMESIITSPYPNIVVTQAS